MRATYCRCCASENLVLVHDFGSQPLAGRYPVSPESVASTARYPLDLTQCAACGLLQVTVLPPIAEIFNEDYCYSSSSVPDLIRHFEGYAGYLRSKVSKSARIFEFGCNDGILLNILSGMGYACAGIDASDNVASIARRRGLRVSTGFLSPRYVRSEGYEGVFDLVTCSNVFAHIHDLRSTVESVRMLLGSNGLFCVEVHDGELLIGEGQFDTVYHEHLTYFTQATLRRFLESEGFEYVDCENTPMHGGGLRMCMRKSRVFEPGSIESQGLETLSDFVEPKIAECRGKLNELSRRYGQLHAYGAAGRAQMFINFTGSKDLFCKVFDDSPLRQNRYIAGTDIPVTPYAQETGQCCVILAWNYAPTISEKVKQKFSSVVTLLPEFKQW